jgi:hypothetical protein
VGNGMVVATYCNKVNILIKILKLDINLL